MIPVDKIREGGWLVLLRLQGADRGRAGARADAAVKVWRAADR